MNDNLKIYEKLRNVPEHAKKAFNNGRFSGTDINPMWRIKAMTEQFGICGIGWYYDVVARHLEKSSDGITMCAFVAINLYIKVNSEWSKPIYGEGGNTFAALNKYEKIVTSDEAFKMALTDALSNATKYLGLGADVWFENDKIHGTKYDMPETSTTKSAPKTSAVKSTPEAPETPNTRQMATQALNFMKSNKAASEYYLARYGQNDVIFLSDAELVEIFNDLKMHNKL